MGIKIGKKILSSMLAILLFVMSFIPSVVVKAEEEKTSSYILNDAYVDEGLVTAANKGKVMLDADPNKAGRLIIGKGRQVYIRFDLSQIDANEVDSMILCMKQTNANVNTIVVTQAGEYLTENGIETETKWNENNITFDNRPNDIEGSPSDTMEWNGTTSQMELKSLLLDAKNAGKDEITLHIAIEGDNSKNGVANEIYSTRDTTTPLSMQVLLKEVEVIPDTDEYVLNDAFVDSASANSSKAMITSKADKLIIGKGRHAYIRFNISQIDADEVASMILYVTQTHANNTIVVTQAGEYLREEGTETETKIKWDENNITYKNRPVDLANSQTYTMEWDKKATFQMDLTSLLVDARSKGKNVITLHITTKDVETSTIDASEIYSTRSITSPLYMIVRMKNEEQPQAMPVQKSGDTYLESASIAQKTVRIKAKTGQYLKLAQDGKSFETTDIQSEGSIFAVYISEYAYPSYELENYGSSITTFAIKCLDNNKYLTIQNYFEESDASKNYYNLNATGKYEIQAQADEVNWNERFYIDYYETAGYYTISSHLLNLRDDPSFSTAPVRMTTTEGLCTSASQMQSYQFQFEDVSDYDQLEVLSKVEGNQAELYWYPVDGDLDTSHYTVDGSVVTTENGKLYATVTDLTLGTYEIEVIYTNGLNSQSDIAKVCIFNHPGISHTEAELDAMREHVQKKEEPWYSDYMKLQSTVADNLNSTSFTIKAYDAIGRGEPAGHGNISDFEQSANAAYFNALQWVITGDSAYADTVVNILNAWSDLKIVDGRDRILGAAINGFKLNNAAEIVRYYHGGYSGYSDTDFKNYQSMMENVIYPVIQDLGAPMVANGNWDTAAMVSMISIGILCENEEIFSRAVELYQDIHINGSIAVYVSDWGQSVESARDQAHAQLGIGYMADVCAAALNQGINLYDLYNYRLAKAFNWAAQYNLYDTNYTFEPLMNVFNNSSRGYWTTLDSEKINRGELRPVYELPLSYYSNVEGVDVTWMKKAAEAMRAQGYVHNDNLNFGTLTTYNGASTAKSEPYFQIRTAIEPWYQRTYSAVKQYDSSVAAGVAETLNSYFAVSEDGTITASLKKADAPYFQLINNDDGTYALKCVSTDKYVSVKADMVGDENVIKADADTVSDSERFTLKATGIGYYYLASPKYDNRAVTIHVDGADTPTSAVLTMRLSNSTKTSSASVTTSERLIFVYNTKSTVLGVEEENCTVTFNTNDGSKVTAQLVEKGSLVTEPSKTEKTGYEFEGWYKDSSLTQKWDFAKDTVTENVTLYAKWTVKDNGNNDDNGDNDDKKFFTITFNTNGGSTVSSQTIENGNKVTEPSKPEKTGNEFEGWYKDSSLTQKWDFAKDTVTDSIILYAKWIVKNIDNGYNATIIDNETTNTTDSTSKQVIKVETANQEATVSVTINEKAYESELSTVTVKNPYQLKIELPSSTIVNQIKSDSIKNVKVVVTLPNSFIANESIAINDIMLSKQILTAAKENQKTITLVVNDESKKLLYQWTIDADDLAKASITEGISLGIKTAVANTNSVVKKVLENDSKNSNGVVVTVASKKTLSVQVTNKVYIGEQAGIKVGKKVYVYYYNSTTKKLDTIPGGYSCVVDADGYLSLPIIKGGDYVVLAKKANTKVITSLVNQVQITKSVTLKKDKTSTIKPVLPDWLEKVSKLNISTKYTCVGAVTITYKSSNSSVASVGASSGKITAKKKGTATITATVTLYSGKVKTYKTTVTVK